MGTGRMLLKTHPRTLVVRTHKRIAVLFVCFYLLFPNIFTGVELAWALSHQYLACTADLHFRAVGQKYVLGPFIRMS